MNGKPRVTVGAAVYDGLVACPASVSTVDVGVVVIFFGVVVVRLPKR